MAGLHSGADPGHHALSIGAIRLFVRLHLLWFGGMVAVEAFDGLLLPLPKPSVQLLLLLYCCCCSETHINSQILVETIHDFYHSLTAPAWNLACL